MAASASLANVVLNIVKEKSESKSQHLRVERDWRFVVLNIVKEKSESKSQPKIPDEIYLSVVLNIVKEKSESKSQPDQSDIKRGYCCFKYCQRKI